MLCCACKKNDVAKTYQQEKDGKKQTVGYCLDCYHQLFFTTDEAEGEQALSACPYCSTTVAEIKKTGLVGCAYCYTTLKNALVPEIIRLQGERTHCGKTPISEEGVEEQATKLDFDKASFEKQCKELNMMIQRLNAEGDYIGAQAYKEKLDRMKKTMTIEENFVWRGRLKKLKR